MVISRLHVSKIERNLSLIQEFLAELKNLSRLEKEEFLTDKRNSAASESYLRRSLEAVFDTARHILAKTYGLKELEYKKLATELGERGIVSSEYAGTLVRMAGYQNRMVHLYHEISSVEMHDILRNHLADIDRFVFEIGRFLEEYKKKMPPA